MKDEHLPQRGRRLGYNEVVSTLKACNGSVPKASDALGVSLWRLSRFIAVRPKLKELVNKLRNMIVDVAEGHFTDAVVSGTPWAVKLALQTLGKDRGYTPRTEINHKLTHETDPTKMSDEQLNELVEERAKKLRLDSKKTVIRIDDAVVIKPIEDTANNV
jgi:hypothetical protein